jgi:L-ornithine N5-monooxygenase
MVKHDVELLAIGAGPANLALAVALEEIAPHLARESLVIERDHEVSWQPGLLLPEALSQVSFLKDLVTLRNPRSRFSFLNYLHAVGRLDQFVNMGSFVPYRIELAGYLKWTADALSLVEVRRGCECVAVNPVFDDGTLTGWAAEIADGETIRSRYLVIGGGRDIRIPEPLRGVAPDRVIHSTEYVQRIAKLPMDQPYRVVVIGAGQSAAELFAAVQSDLPASQPTLLTRSIGLNFYETSKFNNELYYGSFVDKFFEANAEARHRILAQMHHTNYAGLAPGMMDALYRQFYLDRLTNRGRLRMITMHDLTGAREQGEEIVLELTDWRTGAVQEINADLVLLGTGFSPEMPALVRRLAATLGPTDIAVTRDYRLIVNRPSTAACYLQGVNEATHGIADSLMSIIAHRANDIVQDILTHRAAHLDTADRITAPAAVA